MSEPTNAPTLQRTMGFYDLLFLMLITNLSLVFFAKNGQAGPVAITLLLVAGMVFYLPLALCVIVLAKRYPGEGGPYLWSKRSFGDFAGFITGWTYWTAILPFLPFLLYFISGSALFIGGERWQHLANSPTYFVTASLCFLAVATGLNVAGLRIGKWLHNAGAIGVWMAGLLLIGLALIAWLQHGSITNLSASEFVPTFGVKEMVLWPAVIFTLTGLESAAIFGDEIKSPRHFPIALMVVVGLGLLTQVVGTLAALVAIPASGLRGSGGFMQSFGDVAARVGVHGLIPFVAVLVVIGYVGKVGAWSATGARLPMVAGLDKGLLAPFGRIHPRWGSPHVSLFFQAAIVAVLVIIGQAGTTARGAFEVLLSMALVPTFVPYLYMFAAAIKLQRAQPGPGRMQTALGRLATSAACLIGFVTTFVSMMLAVIPPQDEPNKTLYVAKVVGLAAVLLGAGGLLFVAGRRSGAEPGWKPV